MTDLQLFPVKVLAPQDSMYIPTRKEKLLAPYVSLPRTKTRNTFNFTHSLNRYMFLEREKHDF